MRYCSNCGTLDTLGHAFCASCGTEFPVAETTRPLTAPTAPPTRPGQQYGAPRLPSLDWRTIVVGNWLGAGITAAAVVGTAGLLSTAVGLLAKPDNFGIDNTLTMIAAILGATFGADLAASGTDGAATIQLNIAMFPLMISLLTALVGVLVFRRVTARYPAPLVALGDAARAALVVALSLVVIAVIFRSDTSRFGAGWATDTVGNGTRVAFGASVVGCLFLGFLTVFCTLALTVFLRREWWGPRMQQAHEWLAAPLYGAATILALLPLAGLLGIGLLLFGDSNTEDVNNADDTMAGIAVLFSLLANGGLWLIALGSGAAFGTSDSSLSTSGLDSNNDLHHLSFFTDNEPGLWAAPLVMLLVILAGAFVVSRRSAHPSQILGNLMRWVALLLVFLPLLVRLASGHVGISTEGGGDSADGFLGPDGVQTTVFLGGAALVCAVIVAALCRAIDPARIRAQLSRLGAQVQSSPAASEPPAYAPVPSEAESLSWGPPPAAHRGSTGDPGPG